MALTRSVAPARASASRQERIAFADALGLSRSSDYRVIDAHAAAFDEVATLWPMVVVIVALIPLLFGSAAWIDGTRGLSHTVALYALPPVLLALLGWVVIALPAARGWPTHVRTIALGLIGGALAITLSMLLARASHLPTPTLQLGTIVAAAGGIVATAAALHSVRAASLAFAAALTLMVPVIAGPGFAAIAALLILVPLGLGTFRLARRDRALLEAREEADAEGRRAAQLVAEYEAHGTGWFWQTDRQGALTYLSPKVANEIRGMGLDPMRQRLTNIFRVDSDMVDTERTLTFHLSSRTSFSDYSVRPTFADADRWWSISGRPMLDDLGRYQGFIGSGSDLTEKRRAEAEITRLALFDSLTGLANRQRMRLSLDQMLGPQHAQGTTGLFLLDLDRFKAVNDTLGHQTGDALLRQVALRLQREVGDAGLVGRLGGDEFQIILPREGNRDTLAMLARKVIGALSEPYFLDGSSVTIGCSIGVAISPEHGNDAETLIRNADLALYAAKADGRGVHRFYRGEMLAGAQSRKRLEDDLRIALQNDQFHLTYQPVVATEGERIVGYEALLRWDHPTRGAISPADFIPVAEECGMIEAIGEWVMRTACLEAARWPAHVRVAVNVSPIQFANPALPAIVTSALAAAGIPAQRLELEITEGVFLNETAASEQMFKSLKGIGVRLALDDFGTGYSSLGYLRKAPFDKIKIDQSFVRGAIQPGNRNAAIIKAIVTLADTLYMETTAEGVEQQDEIALIRQLGCSHIQGFVYGRPMRAEDVRAQLAEQGGKALAIGHKVSRPARPAMLRSARLEIGDEVGEVRIRNMSATGAMIDGVDLSESAIGYDVLIELVENQMFAATVRWAGAGKAGLEFAENFNLERLNTAASKPPVRKAG